MTMSDNDITFVNHLPAQWSRNKTVLACVLGMALTSLSILFLHQPAPNPMVNELARVRPSVTTVTPAATVNPEPPEPLKSRIPALTLASSRSAIRLPSLKELDVEDDPLEKLVIRDRVLVIPTPGKASH